MEDEEDDNCDGGKRMKSFGDGWNDGVAYVCRCVCTPSIDLFCTFSWFVGFYKHVS